MTWTIQHRILLTVLVSFLGCTVWSSIGETSSAQEKLTETTVATDKFGPGGKVITQSDAKLKIHLEMWVGKDGKIIETHEIIYDSKGQVTRETWSFKGLTCEKRRHPPDANGKWDGKWFFDCDTENLKNATSDDVEKRIDAIEQRTKERLTASDKPKTETPSTAEPKKIAEPTKTKEDSGLPEPSTSAEVVDGRVPGYSSTIKTPTGLFTTVLTTPSKDVIEIYLPRNLVAGETVLGSMKVTPAKPGGLSVPLSFQIGLGDYIEVWNRPFTVKLNDQPLTKLRVLDEKKIPVTEVDFHTSQKQTRLSDFSVPSNATRLEDFFLPTSGTFGNLLGIQARDLVRFDDFLKPGGGVFIGNQPMPIIAATPHEIVTRIDYDKPGLTEIEIKTGSTDVKRPFRVLTLDLSADSLNLLKGESTTVHIVVHGLEHLYVSAHMKIVVSGAVTMTGAGEVEIQPSDISASGTYTTTRTLHAVEAGGFGVNVTVTVDKELQTLKSNQKDAYPFIFLQSLPVSITFILR